MLVRPGSEEVMGAEADDSFGEFMKLRFLRENNAKNKLQEDTSSVPETQHSA
jgi:hypothetical protein